MSHSQIKTFNPSKEYDDINYFHCVKSINVKIDNYSKNETQPSRFFKLVFFNDSKIKEWFDYGNSFEENPIGIFKYDSLKRPTLVEWRKNDTTTYKKEQYFTKNNLIPDSINVYYNGKTIGTHYKNYFRDSKVVKQETYTNDTLRSYIVFEYDSNNRLKKQININTNNGFGIILDKSFTGNTTKKYLNENDTITYKNVEIGDTLVTSKYIRNELRKIEKHLITKKYSIEVIEDYTFGYLFSTNSNFSSTDSIIEIGRWFDREGKEKGHWKRTITSQINILEGTEENTVTKIERVYDENKNWIKKTFIKDDFVTRVIHRKIVYCN
jgi:hypothetical protein